MDYLALPHRNRSRLMVAFSFLLGIGASVSSHAGTITAAGAVSALTNINQMVTIDGIADFNAGPADTNVSLTQYQSQGLTFHVGPTDGLAQALPGATAFGYAVLAPQYKVIDPFPSNPVPLFFDAPVGGGSADGLVSWFSGIATFSRPVTQFGLTASRNGVQFITAWDTSGNMLGQVTWAPAVNGPTPPPGQRRTGDRGAFVGIDTNGVQIGMIAFGNDDLWNNGLQLGMYDLGVPGAVPISDNWVWGSGVASSNVPDVCGTLGLFGSGFLLLLAVRRNLR